ncbi:MAG TPA: helix-turn-helix transcriptional regulator [Thermoanaerobaculia bacterium]|jgi:transcriptional regulator with XRE-family HTH domain|nr:helix-turn-helix transcriptional regulator [Thermoanaerobaculia bacterium]
MTKSSNGEGEIFGPHLRSLRIARGLTQAELAERADTNTMFISKLERGVTTPTIGTLVRLARALECPVTKLVMVFDRVHGGSSVRRKR